MSIKNWQPIRPTNQQKRWRKRNQNHWVIVAHNPILTAWEYKIIKDGKTIIHEYIRERTKAMKIANEYMKYH